VTDSQNALKVFDFDGRQVRIVEKDGQPWWVAKDVCDVLDIKNTSQAVGQLDEYERSMFYIGRQGEVNIINESGVYALILRSNKPDARNFRKWLLFDVLPAIRRHGGYLTDRKLEEVLTDPDTLIRLARNLKTEKERCRVLEAKIHEDRPKVLFAESVEASDSSILVGDLAKLIRQNGCQMGRKRLFAWLRQNGYLMKIGESRNMPTQKSMESGLFEIKERAINNPNGTILVTRTAKVTGLGQSFFINLFKNRLPGEV
jgi:anti-repressor protein